MRNGWGEIGVIIRRHDGKAESEGVLRVCLDEME